MQKDYPLLYSAKTIATKLAPKYTGPYTATSYIPRNLRDHIKKR